MWLMALASGAISLEKHIRWDILGDVIESSVASQADWRDSVAIGVEPFVKGSELQVKTMGQ